MFVTHSPLASLIRFFPAALQYIHTWFPCHTSTLTVVNSLSVPFLLARFFSSSLSVSASQCFSYSMLNLFLSPPVRAPSHQHLAAFFTVCSRVQLQFHKQTLIHMHSSPLHSDAGTFVCKKIWRNWIYIVHKNV